MTSELSIYAARVREQIGLWTDDFSLGDALHDPAYCQHADIEFSGLAVMLFTLQFKYNAVYRRLCEARGIKPGDVHHWSQIPCVPTAAFKECELTCLHPEDRTHVFHSSGTTEQRPSRHFHNADSLALYEASLWPWLGQNLQFTIYDLRLLSFTPPVEQAPHSSLVHMFDFVRRKVGAGTEIFVGRVMEDGSWALDISAALTALQASATKPLLILGTAFSFVHLLDALSAANLRLQLPARSRVLETGGYKGRSRALPKAELHQLITTQLGVAPEHIICEYGMSELSSQAYEIELERRPPARLVGTPDSESRNEKLKYEFQQHHAGAETGAPPVSRRFKFPPWARARVVSPETGGEVESGETGLLQVFDLANAFSVMAIQTEDLAVRRTDGFELIGRSAAAEPRGCSLMLE
jgi:hypothetical protein